MAVAFDAVGPSSAGTSTTTTSDLSWAHVCGASASLLLVGVAMGNASSTDASVTLGVTYNGVAMTSLGKVHSNNQTAGFIELFYLQNPATGSNTVTCTMSGGGGTRTRSAGSVSYTGTNTTVAPVPTTAFGSGATASVVVSSATDHMVAAAMATGTGWSAVNQTLRWRKNTNNNSAAGNAQFEDAAGAASVTLTGTVGGSDWWGIIGADITPAPSGFNGTASLAATASIAATGVVPGARLGATATITAAGALGFTGGAAISATATITPSRWAYVTGIDAGKHHFVDQGGQPILPLVDHEWNLMGWGGGRSELSPGATTPLGVFQGYASIQATNGFNGVLVLAVDSNQGGATGPFQNGNTFDGVVPFTGGAIGVLNSTYWSRMDDLINSMAAQGITVFLNLIASYNLATGCAFAGLNTTNAATYGTAIGNRYKDFPNLVYHFGSDYFSTFEDEFTAVVTALRAAGDNHVVMCEYMAESETRKDSSGSSTGTFGTGSSVDVDDIYTYNAAYLETEKSYAQTAPTRPSFYFNGRYDQTTSGYDTILLDDELWGLTSGSHGLFYGAESTWAWSSTAYGHLTTDTLRISWLKALKTFWTGLGGWQDLVPDISSTFITSARGTKVTALASGGGATAYAGGNTYLTGGVTADGKLAVLYTPTSRTITIDGTKMVSSYSATWVDPYNFATTAATPSVTSYATPGNNSQGNTRWLLVLEEAASGVSGSASVAASSSATASGIVGKVAAAALAATVAITATGVVSRSTGASLAATGTITTAGAVNRSTGASLAGTSTITAAGLASAGVGATLAATGSTTATGVVAVAGAGSITASDALAATGVRGAVSGGQVAATGAIAAVGVVQRSTGANLAASATVTAAGTATVVGSGSSSLVGTVTITAAGVVARGSGASLPSTAALVATGVVDRASSAQLAETAVVTATGAVLAAGDGAAQLSGTAAIAATGIVARASSAALAATTALTATGATAVPGASAVGATAALEAAGQVGTVGSAGLGATAELEATGTVLVVGAGAAAVAGSVAILADGIIARDDSASLQGNVAIIAVGDVIGDGTPVANPTLSLDPRSAVLRLDPSATSTLRLDPKIPGILAVDELNLEAGP